LGNVRVAGGVNVDDGSGVAEGISDVAEAGATVCVAVSGAEVSVGFGISVGVFCAVGVSASLKLATSVLVIDVCVALFDVPQPASNKIASTMKITFFIVSLPERTTYIIFYIKKPSTLEGSNINRESTN
jgi:hypothetical protein